MEIDDLVNRLAKYPGLTRKSASKLVFSFIRNKAKIADFIKVFEKIENEITTCSKCGNIAFNDKVEDLCAICKNYKRDSTIACVVEDFEDISNLEKGLWYNGSYHVLGGLLSAQKGMMPENLNTNQLFSRIISGEVLEIIFASTSSFEWQATMHFLIEEIRKIPNGSDIKITEFAHGLPIGSSFEYMDEGTLQVAFSSRKGV
jgi:recombination protein RecR